MTKTTYKSYDVCVTLDDGSECCGTIGFDYTCKSDKVTIWIDPNPPALTTRYAANYKIDSIVAPLLPKHIAIDFYDNNLNHIFNIYDAYVSAEQLEGSIPFNVSDLVSGVY